MPRVVELNVVTQSGKRRIGIGYIPTEVIDESFPIGHAPLLERFNFDNHECFTIPPQWSGDGAPRLCAMKINGFCIGDMSKPFPQLRSFRGSLYPPKSWSNTDARALFQVFPSIVNLQLDAVWSSQLLLPAGTVPRTLTHLALTSARKGAVQYDVFFDRLADLPTEKLSVLSSHSMLPPIRFFPTTIGDTFTMKIQFDLPVLDTGFIYTLLATDGRCLEFTTEDGFWPNTSDFKEIMPHLGRLTRLSVPALLFRNDILPAQLTLPSLLELELDFWDAHELYFRDFPFIFEGERHELHAPRLETLKIKAFIPETPALAIVDWFVRMLPQTLRSWLLFDTARRLSTLQFLCEEPHWRSAAAAVPNIVADNLTVAREVNVGHRES